MNDQNKSRFTAEQSRLESNLVEVLRELPKEQRGQFIASLGDRLPSIASSNAEKRSEIVDMLPKQEQAAVDKVFQSAAVTAEISRIVEPESTAGRTQKR